MAIAVDATSSGSASATSVTVAHTCSGSDRILFVGLWVQINSDVVTGVTYNGVAMTQVGKVVNAGTEALYLYMLVAPASGTNNIVASKTGSELIQLGAASYTGAKQTGQPDASTTNTGSGTSLTTSVTTVADNSWLILSAKHTGAASAGTNTTLRIDQSGNGQASIYDSNAAQTPAGSKSLQTTTGASQTYAHVMASFSPATDIAISVNDSITITESVVMLETSFISVNDAITITESVLMNPVSFINVSDSISITESYSVDAAEVHHINVFEAISIAESVSRTLSVQLSVSDAISITESVTVFAPDQNKGVAMMRGNDDGYVLGMDDLTIL